MKEQQEVQLPELIAEVFITDEATISRVLMMYYLSNEKMLQDAILTFCTLNDRHRRLVLGIMGAIVTKT